MSISSHLSPESRQQLQTLAEALAKSSHGATPAPWRVGFRGYSVKAACDYPHELICSVPNAPQPPQARWDVWLDNADLIVEMRNSVNDLCDGVVALLSALAAQEAENERLRQAMTALEKRWRADMLTNKQFANRQTDYWQKQLADAQAQTARQCADELAALRQSLSASTPEQET